MRPLHLMVTFWGDRYRSYLVDLCLPSLLAPNNLRLLSADDEHKFFFATTQEDWNEIRALPILTQLAEHVQPMHVEIATPRPGEYLKIIGQEQAAFRQLLDAAYSRTAFGCLLSPDVMAPDGFIESLLHRMNEGAQLVLSPSLRQVEGSVLKELDQLGILPLGTQLSRSGGNIVIPKRVAARLMVQHLHPDLFCWEEGAADQPRFSPVPPFRYWRSERGLILHTFFGTPVLIDFSYVAPDHTACLDDERSFEIAYLPKNFSGCKRIHVVRDSDEFGLLSLTPSGPFERIVPRPNFYRSLRSIRFSYKAFTRNGEDWVRSLIASSITRWHWDDFDRKWFKWERAILRLLNKSVGDYWQGTRSPRREILYRIASVAAADLATAANMEQDVSVSVCWQTSVA